MCMLVAFRYQLEQQLANGHTDIRFLFLFEELKGTTSASKIIGTGNFNPFNICSEYCCFGSNPTTFNSVKQAEIGENLIAQSAGIG